MQHTAGFMLGLSTGVVCLAYCGPVLVPYLMGEGRSVSGNAGSVILFLSGRLMAYLLIGLISGIIGQVLLQPSSFQTVFTGILYLLLGAVLVLYGFYRFREICLGRRPIHFNPSKARRWPFLIPLTGGFVTGLNLCPPFLLAITGAIETGKIGGSIGFFTMFFLGTSIYFIPLPFIGVFRRQQVLRIIGKFAAILAGILYIYKGVFMLI